MTDTSSSYLDSKGEPRPERRSNHRVRAVLDEAWPLIESLLAKREGKPELSGFSLAIELRDHFPDLSQSDLNLLVSAAMRMQREHRTPVPGGKRRS